MDKGFKETLLWLEVPIHMWEFTLEDNDEYKVQDLHSEVEQIIRDVGDVRKKETNVKAHMTSWLMTEYKPFKYICDHVEKVIQDWHREKTDLELKTFMTTCWVLSISEEIIVSFMHMFLHFIVGFITLKLTKKQLH